MFPSLRSMETMLPRFQGFPGFTYYLEHAQNLIYECLKCHVVHTHEVLKRWQIFSR